jgi:hypothetical protein
MKVAALVNTYVAYKRSLGMRYRSQAAVLNAFARSVGDLDIRQVTADLALAFIAGKGAVTAAWQVRFHVLNGLYRFAPLPRPRCYLSFTDLSAHDPTAENSLHLLNGRDQAAFIRDGFISDLQRSAESDNIPHVIPPPLRFRATD